MKTIPSWEMTPRGTPSKTPVPRVPAWDTTLRAAPSTRVPAWETAPRGTARLDALLRQA